MPQLTWGGCTPKPKNDSVDSVMMATATVNVAATMIGPMQFGMRWREIKRQLDAPRARPASMNSFSFSDSTWPRTMRAVAIHDTITSRVIVSRIEVVAPKAVLAHACFSRQLADDQQGDEQREGQEQVGPAHQEVVELAALEAGEGPDQRADDAAERATATPMNSEMRPPQRMSEYMSRPIESVPNQ